MKYLLASLIVGAVLFFTACAVTSDHPVVEMAASESVPDSLLGTWIVRELHGKPPSSVIRVSAAKNQNGSLQLKITDGSGSQTMNASTAHVGGSMVLSFSSETGEDWALLAAQLDSTAGRLVVKEIYPSLLSKEIERGAISGRVSEFDHDDVTADITATSDRLRQYLEGNIGIFTGIFAVLEKEGQP